ncbi:Der1-like family-domain-containing protein [Absidia repens]|uniref:Derlin n=1 Tax=Absidia repens TaxID=90262 RepID=A0A1X2HL54_9FUNG|nr:Der1-like family-domain-containing protein [Absidia repens]
MPPSPQQTSVQNEFIRWYNSMPTVTKAIMTASTLLTVSSTLRLIKMDRLALIWPLVLKKYEFWRLLSTFYTSHLNLSFIFNLYFMYMYSTRLETEVFQGQTADYVYFLLLTNGTQLVLDKVFENVFFLSGALVPSLMYLWSRHFPNQIVSFMFGLRFKAIFLPWVVAGYEYVANNGRVPYSTLYGIGSAHLYYYFKSIYPTRGGRRYLDTPRFFQRLFRSSTGPRRSPGAGQVWPNQQQQRQQENQERTNFMGGHSWGRGHRLT